MEIWFDLIYHLSFYIQINQIRLIVLEKSITYGLVWIKVKYTIFLLLKKWILKLHRYLKLLVIIGINWNLLNFAIIISNSIPLRSQWQASISHKAKLAADGPKKNTKSSSTDSNSMEKTGRKFKTLFKTEPAPKYDHMHKNSLSRQKKMNRLKTKAKFMNIAPNPSLTKTPKSSLPTIDYWTRKSLSFLFISNKSPITSTPVNTKAHPSTSGQL